ncbi:MAG: SpoIIE family protein phosphatase [Prevotella sp.]|nr:SpoIIE family protein phosphatase [Candidatus Equicola faecalis]
MKLRYISQSFSARLTVSILAVTAVLFTIAIGIMAISSRKLIEKEASRGAENILKATVNGIDKILAGVESSANSTVWMIKEHKDDADYMFTITKNLVQDNDFIVGSSIAFIPNYYPKKGEYFAPYSYKKENSNVLKSFQMGNEDYDYHTMEWFQLPYLLKQPGWCEPYYDEGGGEQMMTTYSVPIMDDDGNVFAVLTADISLYHLTEQISATRPYPHSYTILLSNNGSYISHPKQSYILNETILSHAYETGDSANIAIAKDMVNKKAGICTLTTKEGEKALAIFRPISNGWVAAILCPYSDVLEKVTMMHIVLAVVLFVGLCLLVVFCWLSIRKLTRPLSEFSISARSIAQGNFNTELPEITSHDEMKHLYDSFMYMQNSLNSYINELKQTTAVKERIQSELSIARDIQCNMVPTNFLDNLYAVLQPAKEVGGDLYDFYKRNDDIQFAIGDVSGKGVPAALFMAITRSSFMFVGDLRTNLEATVARINNVICVGNKEILFVTMFVARYNTNTHILQYCNAGHNPIVVIEPTDTEGNTNAYFLKAKPNIVVGLMSHFKYEKEELTVKPGTRLILYTDGVTEAENADKDQYGEERLLAFARRAMEIKDVKACTEALLNDVKNFTNGNEQNDDITIMIIDL